VLERVALRLTGWAERWLPDAYVFALIATLVVLVAGLAIGVPAASLVDAWGKGFWDLLAFAMQMILVIVTGHVVADAPATRRAIAWLASLPSTPRAAVAFVALISLVTSWFNWGFGLIAGAVLVRAIARRGLHVDYRALAAASLLGLGSVWAQGLSGSAAIQMATPGALSPALRQIVEHGGVVPGGLITFRDTIFLRQSFIAVAIELVVVVTLMWLLGAPTAQPLQIEPDADEPPETRSPGLGPWLDHSSLITLPIALLAVVFLVRSLSAGGVAAITLGTINLLLLTLGLLLHRSPARLLSAISRAVPSTAGVILQFPFYAGIAGMIATTHLNERIAALFVGLATHDTFPPLMALYSLLLGVFVPSGGGKWIIEAPYVMRAAHELRVHLGWTVSCYDLGEAVANLIQPFWMIPVLGLYKLKARDVMGYTFVVFVVLCPFVLLLTWALGRGLPYPL
jgi:short-chain fatty acids transporter